MTDEEFVDYMTGSLANVHVCFQYVKKAFRCSYA